MSETINLAHPRYWFSWFWMGVLRVLGWLPFAFIYALSAALGELFFLLMRSRAQITLTNLRLCLPELSEAERSRMARRHFRLLVCSVLSVGTIWWASKKRLRRLIKVKGIEHLENARKQNQGVIILAPHFVALDAGGMVISMDQPVTSMYQTTKNPVYNKVTVKQRARFDADMFDRKAPLTRLIRKIRSGLPFYYLPDQNAGAKHGIFVPFFGIPASTFPTLGKLALSGRAVVIPSTVRIIPWRGFETVLSAPMENFPVGDAYEDTAHMNRQIEKMVRNLGANYLWSHRRFKRRPEGEPDLYKRN